MLCTRFGTTAFKYLIRFNVCLALPREFQSNDSLQMLFFFFKFCPRWIAPNLLTFTGFLLTIVNFILIGYYDFDFKAANDYNKNVIPNWVWIVASINIFVAYTLGNSKLLLQILDFNPT